MAKLFHFVRAEYFQADDPETRANPQVSFN